MQVLFGASVALPTTMDSPFNTEMQHVGSMLSTSMLMNAYRSQKSVSFRQVRQAIYNMNATKFTKVAAI